MEKSIKNNKITFLDIYKLLSNHQHGLRNKKSCTTNLLETLDIAT